MSRAFVKDNDDWFYCIRYKDTCMFANENGDCFLKQCKKQKEKDKSQANLFKINDVKEKA